ncbi:hypothetical protein KAR91_44250 [Candidatus Pacearchaeota archaeon]|nr:hypothetical protein [Candidatus Pacearchaeota archaeon]
MKSIPEFKKELTGRPVKLPLDSFPVNNLPSGGMSTRISPSEMFMVLAESSCPNDRITMIWKDSNGRVISKFTENSPVVYEFLGHFGWEIDMPGKYTVDVSTSCGFNKTVEYEVT